MSTVPRQLREIEAETRYFTLDRLLLVPIVIAFAVFAMVLLASAIEPTLAGVSQALQQIAAARTAGAAQ
jgi:hypothetical protein